MIKQLPSFIVIEKFCSFVITLNRTVCSRKDVDYSHELISHVMERDHHATLRQKPFLSQ